MLQVHTHFVGVMPVSMGVSLSKRWSIFLSWNWHCVRTSLSSEYLFLRFFIFIISESRLYLKPGSASPRSKYFISHQLVCTTHNRRHLASFKRGWRKPFPDVLCSWPSLFPACEVWSEIQNGAYYRRFAGQAVPQLWHCGHTEPTSIQVFFCGQRCFPGRDFGNNAEQCPEHVHVKMGALAAGRAHQPCCSHFMNHSFLPEEMRIATNFSCSEHRN